MKIAINGIFFIPKGGGIKEYIKNLITNLIEIDNINFYILYVSKGYLEYVKDLIPSSNLLKIKEIPFEPSQKIKRSLSEYSFWREEELSEKFDLFHSPFFYSPSFKNAKVILTVHDLRFCRYPETYPFLRYCFLKFKVKKSLDKCSKIISISEFTKNEILHFYKIDSNKVEVIHEAIDLNFFTVDTLSETVKIPFGLEKQNFILYVAHIEPRKNHRTLIKVFNELKKEAQNRNLSLVIVGQKTKYFEEINNLFDVSENVYYLDFVEHSLLIWLYKNAKLFVFPSFYEGFGFPPLEAAALNTVSAVANVSSMPEICGNASFYFNPFDETEMFVVINEALHDNEKVEEKREKLKKNLARFSWRKNAEQTLMLYQEVYSNK